MSEIDEKIVNEESSIKRDNVVIESGKIQKNITTKSSNRVKERREKVKELYIAGKIHEEIASLLGLTRETVYSDITILIKAGEIQKREKRENKEKRKNKESKQVRERREQVKKLKEEGKGNKEIANLLGITAEIVYSDIRIMRKAGELQIPIKDEKKIIERREQVKKLKEAGKTYREMASILGTNIATVHSDLEAIKEKERSLLKSKNKKNKNKLSFFSDIDKKVIQGDKRLKRIVKYITTCENGQHAINYAKSHQNSRYLTEEGREVLKRFIKKSENAQSRNVMRLLNDGKSLKEIKEITDYEESMIVRTNNTYLKNKSKTENER